MRDKNGPRITMSGKLMVEVPTDLTIKDAFSNFEELARGTENIDSANRLILLRSLVNLGELAGVMPEKTSPREALGHFETIAMAHKCNHHLRMALLQSVDMLEDLVETEEAQVEAEKAKSKSGEKATEADGTQKTTGSPTEETSAPTPDPPKTP